VPLSVYQRLQKLENRILELEGLSPEYFQSAVSSSAAQSPPLIPREQQKENVAFICRGL
jgi:hypothetical protein